MRYPRGVPSCHDRDMDVAALLYGDRVATRAYLVARGATGYQLTAAVRAGTLIRVRRGHYAIPGLEPRAWQAVRIGGVLTCLSAAAAYGIWVPPHLEAHVAIKRNAARLRSPRFRYERLTAENRRGCTLHWWPLMEPVGAHTVSIADCLAHLIRCQPRSIAVAALDSALHTGAITRGGLRRILDAVPAGFAGLAADVDHRAMSGLESIVRLLLKDAGLAVEPQVSFPGVGAVDLVVEDCVVVETDGKEFHDAPEFRKRDYRRDARLAALEYTVLRFDFEQVMFQPEEVLAAVHGSLRAHFRWTRRH